MEIYGTFRQKVGIYPLDVIQQLKTDFLGDDHRWIATKEHYKVIMKSESAGTHSYDKEVRILTEEEVKYWDALVTVEEFLRNN